MDLGRILKVINKADIDLGIEDLDVKVFCADCGKTSEYTQITFNFNASSTEMTLSEISELQTIFDSLLEIYDQENYENKTYPILEVNLANAIITIGDGGMGDAFYIEIDDDMAIEQYVLQNSQTITDILNTEYTYKWLKLDLGDGILYLIDYDNLYGDETRLDFQYKSGLNASPNDVEVVKNAVQAILDEFTFFIQ